MKMPKLGDEFRPSSQLIKLYYAYIVMVVLLVLVPLMLPLAVFRVYLILWIVGLPLVAGFIGIMVWLPMYYRSISYKMTRDELVWRRGVWFKNTGIVPYNRITNVDIVQGPVSRRFGIASLKIQTAGYSGANQRSSELRLEGIERFEELRESIMSLVRGRKPVAVEAGVAPKGDVNELILRELVRIRKSLGRKK